MRGYGRNSELSEFAAKALYDRASDRHNHSDTKVSGMTMIISNKAVMHPFLPAVARTVRQTVTLGLVVFTPDLAARSRPSA